jgi:hypothetical protein
MGHKFKLGQSVVPKFLNREPHDVYEVVGLMPELPNGDPQYRVRAASSGVERVVREFEIKAA